MTPSIDVFSRKDISIHIQVILRNLPVSQAVCLGVESLLLPMTSHDLSEEKHCPCCAAAPPLM